MKISASKNDLMNSINIVMKAVPGKTTMSILYCILVDATVDNIKLIANDMELGIETILDGTIEERGIVALDAKLFSEIIRKLPESDILIETDPATLETTIICGTAVFHISGKDGTEFAPLPSIDREQPVCLNQFQLRELIRQTIFSAALTDANRTMTGELLEMRDNELRMVALDGHRIAIRILNLDVSYGNRKAIIPGKTLNEIMKISSGEISDPVNLYFTPNMVLFEMNKTIVTSRLIEGNFFRIDQMLVNEFESRIKVRKELLMSSVDRAILFSNEQDKRPLVMKVEQNSMNLRIKSTLGSMSDDIDIETEGNEIEIGFNPKYLLEALRVIDGDEITISFISTKAPCFIMDEGPSYIYMILPVNFVN